MFSKSILSMITAFYIFYMFIIFKTTISLNHPFELLLSKNLNNIHNTNQFTHTINNNYESKICPFGRKAIYILIAFLLYRTYNKNISKKINLLVLLITVFVSLLNLNAFIYLLPYIIIEVKYFI